MSSQYSKQKIRLYIFLRKAAVFCFLFLPVKYLCAQDIVLTNNDTFPRLIGENISTLIDKKHQFDSNSIIGQTGFVPNNRSVLILSDPKNNIWLKFKVKNLSNVENLYLSIAYADLSVIKLYEYSPGQPLHFLKEGGNTFRFKKRENNSINFNFPINLPKQSEKTFYLYVNSDHPYQLPISIGDSEATISANNEETIIIGLYCGIMISIILYNLFLYLSTKDKSNLIYVIYLFTLGFAQVTFSGWSFKIFWPNLPAINSYAIIASSCLASITAIVFAKYFLNSAYYSPMSDKLMTILLILYSAITLLGFTKYAWLSYIAFNYFGILQAVLLLAASIIIYKKGNTAALFYFIAWSIPLIGFIIHVLKNMAILPFNTFTRFALYIGSAIEAILLSLALANKINILRDEKELSQAEALNMSKENERLIQEQNVMLEKQVSERTRDLEKTLSELKDAQTQLVESEKMASLGQLTAGIAHEINNPINFVKSNVSPLQMDVQDLFELISEYQKLHQVEVEAQPEMLKKIRTLENRLDPDFLKEEIESLVSGIEEGAERTAEIVRGLRSFSRLDESESKEVSIYENINSTLILLRNHLPHYVKVRKHFEARPEIECYPGKLNQVFMNILTNSIHAIKIKPVKSAEEYIDISITEEHDYMRIRIADTGIGMTDEVKRKIFEPFFTTKDVGEGTGLGMAIVFKIIEKHNGKISVQSSPGEGAAFIIEIPYLLRSEAAITENLITENEMPDHQ